MRPPDRRSARAAPAFDPALFAAVEAGFTEAQRRYPRLRECHYQMAGRLVRLRIVGDRLADCLERPFAHLRAEATAEPPALTIDLWHGAETEVRCAVGGEATFPGLSWYSVMSASQDGRFIAEYRPHCLAVADRHEGRIIAWIPSVEQLYLDERARPFQRMMAIWLADLGIQRIHAGLVAKRGRGALFVGRSGSGKSTSSIACLLDGFSYLGDDCVGISAEPDGSFAGYGIYGTGLIDPGHMARYPELAAFCAPGNHPEEDKQVVSFAGIAAGRLERKVTIGAVVLPRVIDAVDTTFRRAPAAEALLALAPSSILFVPGAGPRLINHLGGLVERVPAYRLELGWDVRQIAGRVDELLEAG
jgi:hypothetical protein